MTDPASAPEASAVTAVTAVTGRRPDVVRIEREHLPDGREISYYSWADEQPAAVAPTPEAPAEADAAAGGNTGPVP